MAEQNQTRCEENSTSDFPIGTQFVTRGKAPRFCTVVDVLKTYNSKGELVSTRYVTEHDGPFGQKIVSRDVVRTTILMGLVREVA